MFLFTEVGVFVRSVMRPLRTQSSAPALPRIKIATRLRCGTKSGTPTTDANIAQFESANWLLRTCVQEQPLAKNYVSSERNMPAGHVYAICDPKGRVRTLGYATSHDLNYRLDWHDSRLDWPARCGEDL